MRIFVQAKPGAFEERVEQVDSTHYVVSVREPPRNGLANRAIRAALARHQGIASVRVTLRSGFASRNKIFEIL